MYRPVETLRRCIQGVEHRIVNCNINNRRQRYRRRNMSAESLITYADIEDEFSKDTQLRREDVAKLAEWQRQQPHLPPPLHPIESALYLHSCYYSNEAAKRTIDSYYTFRTHCPEFYAGRDPLGAELQSAMDTCLTIVLPDLTPDGNIVFYFRMLDTNPRKFVYNSAFKLGTMMIDLRLKQRGCHNGHVGIFDLEGTTMTAVALRITAVHFVNGVSFMEKILTLIRPFMNKKLHDVIHVHYGDNSSIFKDVPKEILPIECGGSKFCATEYYKNVMRKDIEMHSDYYKMDEHRKVDESKRPVILWYSGEMFGIDGTFKNLNID